MLKKSPEGGDGSVKRLPEEDGREATGEAAEAAGGTACGTAGLAAEGVAKASLTGVIKGTSADRAGVAGTSILGGRLSAGASPAAAAPPVTPAAAPSAVDPEGAHADDAAAAVVEASLHAD